MRAAVVPRIVAAGIQLLFLLSFAGKSQIFGLVVYDVWNNPPVRYGPPIGRNRLWRGRGRVGVRIRRIHLCSQHGRPGDADEKQDSLHWLAGKDLKVDLHFVLHLDHSATDADGLDSKIRLLENCVGGPGIATLLHVQTDRLRDAV
jgi:hypothetical protein